MSPIRLSPNLLEDLVLTRSWTLGAPELPRCTKDSAVLFLRSGPRSQRRCLYEFDPALGSARLLLAPDQLPGGLSETLSIEEQAHRERMRVQGSGFTSFDLADGGRKVLLELSGKLYLLERGTEAARVRLLAEPRQEAGEAGPGPLLDPGFSPDGRWVSFVRGRELHVLSVESGEERALSAGAGGPITNGLAEFVAQEEMGRFSGNWWSPDSRRLIYQQTDNSGVERFYIANPADPAQPPLQFEYPRAGQKNALVSLGIVSVEGGPTTWIEWDRERFPYLAEVRWESSGPPTIQVQSRDQTLLRLLQVDPDSGKTTELLEIRDPAWVNLHGARAAGYEWLDQGRFLWTREVEEGWVLELRSADGSVLRTLTPPDLGLLRLVGASASLGWAWIEAGPLPERRLYRVPLAGGPPEPFPPGVPAGVHSASLSADRESMFHVEAALEGMPRTFLRSTSSGDVVAEIPGVAEAPPPELRARLEFLRAGRHQCSAVIVHPPDFDPERRWPVVVVVYGGPHAIRVHASRSQHLQEAWLAAQGFVVVTIDGRGSWGHGRAWERPIHHRLGSVPLEDQADALCDLGRRYPFLDLDRVGIYGWSFGGYLSAMAVMRRPDLYKAAVAGAPVTDWELYDTHYTERYMGLPQEQPAAYRQESVLTHAPGLERPLMILHGTADDNVYFHHSLKLCDTLVRAGRRFELVPLASQTHRVHDPVLYRREWELIGSFFTRHLGVEA